MNGIGRLVRRAFSEQGIHCVEARRGFVSCASSTTSFRPHDSTSPFESSGQKRGLKSLCKFKGKSAGRNSSGRITIFHRGGGAKRLQRRIDLKRSTASMGVVERVEYDPNRSARIALVRWTGEMQLPRLRKHDGAEKPAPPLRKSVDLSGTPLRGAFSYAMMPGIRRSDNDHRTRKNQPKDVFSSALSAPVSRSVPFPRIAIAGAGPAFVATRAAVRGAGGAPSSSTTVCEVQKCDQSYGVRRMRREEALSWQSFREVGTLDLVTRTR